MKSIVCKRKRKPAAALGLVIVFDAVNAFVCFRWFIPDKNIDARKNTKKYRYFSMEIIDFGQVAHPLEMISRRAVHTGRMSRECCSLFQQKPKIGGSFPAAWPIKRE